MRGGKSYAQHDPKQNIHTIVTRLSGQGVFFISLYTPRYLFSLQLRELELPRFLAQVSHGGSRVAVFLFLEGGEDPPQADELWIEAATRRRAFRFKNAVQGFYLIF